jgi:hypothetical protein
MPSRDRFAVPHHVSYLCHWCAAVVGSAAYLGFRTLCDKPCTVYDVVNLTFLYNSLIQVLSWRGSTDDLWPSNGRRSALICPDFTFCPTLECTTPPRVSGYTQPLQYSYCRVHRTSVIVSYDPYVEGAISGSRCAEGRRVPKESGRAW